MDVCLPSDRDFIFDVAEIDDARLQGASWAFVGGEVKLLGENLGRRHRTRLDFPQARITNDPHIINCFTVCEQPSNNHSAELHFLCVCQKLRRRRGCKRRRSCLQSRYYAPFDAHCTVHSDLDISLPQGPVFLPLGLGYVDIKHTCPATRACHRKVVVALYETRTWKPY